MTTPRVRRLRNRAQALLRPHGARLSSLDTTQNQERIRNNNIEGEDYPHPGESIIMANQHTTTTKSSAPSIDEAVAPAGGKSDSDVVASFAEALKRPGTTIQVKDAPQYGRLFLEAAIPTAVVVGGVVVMSAAIIAIDNKWGHGARMDRLIDRGAFDNLTGNMDAAALLRPAAES